MKKIAVCFLVTKNIVNLDVWAQWWQGYEDYINIYSHFSEIGKITQPILLNNRVSPVPTKWGDVSLVFAEGQLYKEAIQNKENKFFILVSDTCIPVRTFPYIYNRIMNNKKGMLGYRLIGSFKDDVEPFIREGDCDGLLSKFKFYGKKVYASDQWKILNRNNVKDFLKMLESPQFKKLFTDCIKIVPDSLAPDELMYVNWMNKKTKGKLHLHFRDFAPTFVDFKGKAIHPINYRQITKNISDDICETKSLFMRKFPEPIEKRLIRQTPVKCYRKRSFSRGSLKGSIKSKNKKIKKRSK